jgi:hypothetical protein
MEGILVTIKTVLQFLWLRNLVDEIRPCPSMRAFFLFSTDHDNIRILLSLDQGSMTKFLNKDFKVSQTEGFVLAFLLERVRPVKFEIFEGLFIEFLSVA